MNENKQDKELLQTFIPTLGYVHKKSTKCGTCTAIFIALSSLGTAFMAGYYLNNTCQENDGSGM